jgi:hypothetical protein
MIPPHSRLKHFASVLEDVPALASNGLAQCDVNLCDVAPDVKFVHDFLSPGSTEAPRKPGFAQKLGDGLAKCGSVLFCDQQTGAAVLDAFRNTGNTG